MHFYVTSLGPRSRPLFGKDETITFSVAQFKNSSILFLNYVLEFFNEPNIALQVAKGAGFKTIVIQESPKNGTYKSDFYPKVKLSDQREKIALQKYRAKGRSFLDQFFGEK